MFEITKEFTDGLLKGLTYTEKTNVKFILGKTYKGCCGTSSYKIIKIVEL